MNLPTIPIQDTKPQLWWAGRLLGMDIYLAVPKGSNRRFNKAIQILSNVERSPHETKYICDNHRYASEYVPCPHCQEYTAPPWKHKSW